MNKALGIFGGSTLIYAGLAVIMGVLPGIWLSHVPPGPGVTPLTPEEARGRDIYVAEGCFYCHTQQVRPLPGDRMFGRPSAPSDYAYQTPELLGSERNGPDLSNVGARQSSSVWQYIHLYEPRAVVPESIMPAFPWLFRVVDKAPAGEQPVPLPPSFAPAHGVVVPTEDGEALVAYLLSLKQPSLPQAQPGGAPSAVVPPAAGGAPGFDAAAGAEVFAANCAACHGAEGKGVPGAFPPLAGDPVVNAANPTEQISTVLHGLQGKEIGGQKYSAQMPAFASQLSDEQIADVIDHERTSWGNHGSLITSADVVTVRANQPARARPAAAAAAPAPATSAVPPAAKAGFNAAEGARLFAANCAACHGAMGTGVPGVFPPLAHDPVVTAPDPTAHIRTVLDGLKDKAISGVNYAAQMPSFAAQLSNEQIADIIDHERTSWGNNAPPVTPQDVAKQRAKKK
ncbi:MAG TPA: c-type cytochrome [Alphaproteobacteria bacterium]|nr:c-type cytochrome [Alphaproteobacteria bacterium]